MNEERSLTFREYPPLLLDLVSAREILIDQHAIAVRENLDVAAAQRDLDEVEAALRECITALVKKSDGFAAYIRSEQADAAAAKAESDRCYDLAKRRQARVDRMKAIGVEVLQSLGVKFIKGETSELRRWGNGGPHPVEVRQPELLPAKYQRFEIRMTGDMLCRLIRLLIDDVELDSITDVLQAAKPIEPDTDLIRKDLLKRTECKGCDGHAIIERQPCKHCGGVGSFAESVPGAVLVDRGEHLRVT